MLYPKIGILHTIDGRCGDIRKFPEVPTMGMTQRAATLILHC